MLPPASGIFSCGSLMLVVGVEGAGRGGEGAGRGICSLELP